MEILTELLCNQATKRRKKVLYHVQVCILMHICMQYINTVLWALASVPIWHSSYSPYKYVYIHIVEPFHSTFTVSCSLYLFHAGRRWHRWRNCKDTCTSTMHCHNLGEWGNNIWCRRGRCHLGAINRLKYSASWPLQCLLCFWHSVSPRTASSFDFLPALCFWIERPAKGPSFCDYHCCHNAPTRLNMLFLYLPLSKTLI